MNEGTAQELWKLTYKTFEHGFDGSLGPVLATKAMAHEIQFRMMHAIADLKTASDNEQHLCEAILADVLLSESMGLMTTETSKRMQELLAPFVSVQ